MIHVIHLTVQIMIDHLLMYLILILNMHFGNFFIGPKSNSNICTLSNRANPGVFVLTLHQIASFGCNLITISLQFAFGNKHNSSLLNCILISVFFASKHLPHLHINGTLFHL